MRATKKNRTHDQPDQPTIGKESTGTGECKWMGKFRNRLKIGDSTLCRWCGAVDETVEHVFNNCESVKVIDIKNKLRVINAKVLHIDPPLGLLFFRDVIGLLKQDIT